MFSHELFDFLIQCKSFSADLWLPAQSWAYFIGAEGADIQIWTT